MPSIVVMCCCSRDLALINEILHLHDAFDGLMFDLSCGILNRRLSGAKRH